MAGFQHTAPISRGGQSPTLTIKEFCSKYYEDVYEWFQLMGRQGLLGENTWRVTEWERHHPLRIAFVGEFNHGRSSMINSLMGLSNILPVSSKRQTRTTLDLSALSSP